MAKATIEERQQLEAKIHQTWAAECIKKGIDPDNPTVEAENLLFNAFVDAFADEAKWGQSYFSAIAKLTPEERQAQAALNNQR